MSEVGKVCKTCMFFEGWHSIYSASCHRHSPSLVDAKCSHEEPRGQFPIVYMLDWCGDWTARPISEEKNP